MRNPIPSPDGVTLATNLGITSSYGFRVLDHIVVAISERDRFSSPRVQRDWRRSCFGPLCLRRSRFRAGGGES